MKTVDWQVSSKGVRKQTGVVQNWRNGYFDYKKTRVPLWVKNNAGWWAEGLIDDDAFAQGIEFLIKEGIIDAGKYS